VPPPPTPPTADASPCPSPPPSSCPGAADLPLHPYSSDPLHAPPAPGEERDPHDRVWVPFAREEGRLGFVHFEGELAPGVGEVRATVSTVPRTGTIRAGSPGKGPSPGGKGAAGLGRERPQLADEGNLEARGGTLRIQDSGEDEAGAWGEILADAAAAARTRAAPDGELYPYGIAAPGHKGARKRWEGGKKGADGGPRGLFKMFAEVLGGRRPPARSSAAPGSPSAPERLEEIRLVKGEEAVLAAEGRIPGGGEALERLTVLDPLELDGERFEVAASHVGALHEAESALNGAREAADREDALGRLTVLESVDVHGDSGLLEEVRQLRDAEAAANAGAAPGPARRGEKGGSSLFDRVVASPVAATLERISEAIERW